MARTDLRTRYAKTPAEKQADLDQATTLDDQAEALKGQISELESTRLKALGDAMRLRHYARQAEYVDDPLICEPHGKESCTEPPGPMSAGAMMHLDDGEVCYAASIGRRSEFTAEELATYRRIKERSR